MCCTKKSYSFLALEVELHVVLFSGLRVQQWVFVTNEDKKTVKLKTF